VMRGKMNKGETKDKNKKGKITGKIQKEKA
jgi:hypothetical protein